jgi:glutamate-1-semialdehyde 2,1-aminomutase
MIINFGVGVPLSLAATRVVLSRFKNELVAAKLADRCTQIEDEIENLDSFKQLENIISFSGHPSWKFISWKLTGGYSSDQIKTFFMQEIFKNGVLVFGTHNISLGIKQRDIRIIIKAYDKALSAILNGLKSNNLGKLLEVPQLEPLFKVR